MDVSAVYEISNVRPVISTGAASKLLKIKPPSFLPSTRMVLIDVAGVTISCPVGVVNGNVFERMRWSLPERGVSEMVQL